MDSLIGFVGDGYVMVACDMSNPRSVVVMHDAADKIMELDDSKLLAAAGELGDTIQFTEYIQKNIHLYKYRTGIQLDTHAAAHFIRGELAKYLRQSPYQCNILVAGFDKHSGQPSLYFMDYIASMHPMKTAAHGYGSFFCLSVLDRHYQESMSEAQGLQLMEKCIKEIQLRLLINQPNYLIKVVDKNGIRTLGESKNLFAPRQAAA
eukprot:tig00020554_g10859.t1